LVSVVLVTYNSMSVLPACIESLENASIASDMEIVVIDNQSADGTYSWVTAYNNQVFSGFHIIKSVNHGYAYANNLGLEYSSGDILLLLNPDTIVSKYAIERCEAALRNRVDIGAVGCRLTMENAKLDKACKRALPTIWNSITRISGISLLLPKSRWFAHYNLTYLDECKAYPVGCLSGAFLMTSRDIYEEVGGLDEDFFMYGEDIEWCHRISQAGYVVWYEGTVGTIHIKGGNGGKKSRASLRHFYNAMLLYFLKTRGLKQDGIISKLICIVIHTVYIAHIVVKRV